MQPPVATSENATQITDDVQSLIDAIPDKCTGVKPYFTDVVEPCLPMALASKAGQSLGMGAMGTCCDAVKKNQNALNSLFGNSEYPAVPACWR